MCSLSCSSIGSSVVRNYCFVFSIFPLLWIGFCVLLLVCSQCKVPGSVGELDA